MSHATHDRSLILSTVFGLGHLRPASGSWGSLPPAALAALLITLGVGPAHSPWIYLGSISLVLIVFSIACVVQGDRAEAAFGAKDPSEVVADEVAGQCIPLLALPLTWDTGWLGSMLWVAAAFVAFRLMDVLKPPPANGLQRLPGGWGILVDDLVAGVYALALVWAVAAML